MSVSKTLRDHGPCEIIEGYVGLATACALGLITESERDTFAMQGFDAIYTRAIRGRIQQAMPVRVDDGDS